MNTIPMYEHVLGMESWNGAKVPILSKLIYCYLVQCKAEEESMRIPFTAFAKYFGTTTNSVRHAITALQLMGWIKSKDEALKSNLYEILLSPSDLL